MKKGNLFPLTISNEMIDDNELEKKETLFRMRSCVYYYHIKLISQEGISIELLLPSHIGP